MVYLGADHGGFHLKEKMKAWLDAWHVAYADCGAKTLDPEDDYPQFAFAVSENVGAGDRDDLPWQERDKGILVCRSAGGVVIAANKVKNVRAVSVVDETSALHSRQHNDANILGLSGDWMSEAEAKKIIKLWLSTEFSGEDRHKRRIGEIRQYEDRD